MNLVSIDRSSAVRRHVCYVRGHAWLCGGWVDCQTVTEMTFAAGGCPVAGMAIFREFFVMQLIVHDDTTQSVVF